MPIYSVLLVDDEAKVTDTIGRFLRSKGFTVFQAHDGVEALEAARKQSPDLVLLDIRMPRMDGIECLKQLKGLFPDIEVVMTTALTELDTAVECMQAGAFGYITKPVDFQSLYTEAGKALEHRELVRKVKDYQENLEQKVEERTREVQALNARLRASFLTSIRILVSLLEVYDPFVGGHLKRVASLAREMGKALKLSAKEMAEIEIAALLHDIGIVALPERLRKMRFSELTADEVALVKQHPIFSQSILSPSAELETAGALIRSHLEHLDGSGFPDGLKDERIPLGARVLGVANAFDEIANRRRFSMEKLGLQEEAETFALNELRKNSGTYFQREIIDALEPSLKQARVRTVRNKKVSIFSLRPGMKLAEDLFNKDGILLLGKEHVFHDGTIKAVEMFHKMKKVGGELLIYEA